MASLFSDVPSSYLGLGEYGKARKMEIWKGLRKGGCEEEERMNDTR